MFDTINHEGLTDRHLLIAILKELRAMTLDLSKVNTSIGRLSDDVAKLITNDAAVVTAVAAATAVHQSQVDSIAPSLDALSDKAEAALAPPVAVA